MQEKEIKFSPIDIEKRRKLDFRAGDSVRVWQKVKEGDKTRLQAFEGLVLARKHGREPGATFTVRKVSDGIGVERVFPLYSPNIDKIEIVRTGKVRRAKLYFIRKKTSKAIRKKIKQSQVQEEKTEEGKDVKAELFGEAAEEKKPKEEKEA